MEDFTDLSISDRIRKVLIYLTAQEKAARKAKISYKFAEQLGIAQLTLANWLNQKSLPNSAGLHKMYVVYPYINYDWIITGRGEMLYREGEQSPPIPRIATAEEKNLLVEILQNELAAKNKTIVAMTQIIGDNSTSIEKTRVEMQQLRTQNEQLKIKLAKAAKGLEDKINDLQR